MWRVLFSRFTHSGEAGLNMPICTNPDCGEISKAKTRFCPHCGQETLSVLKKDELGNFEEKVLTTEIFEKETSTSSAPIEISSNNKHNWVSTFSSFRKGNLNLKNTASFLVFALFVILVVFSASPSAFKDSVFQRIGLQEKFSLNFQEDLLQFKFLDFADNGVPAYFEGCGSIDYYVRQNYASDDDLLVISTALSSLGNGFGRQFVFKGTTQERDVNKLPNSVLIDFTSSVESKEIREAESENNQDLAGLGGPAKYEIKSKPRFESLAASSGNIWINQEYWPSMSREEKITVVMHEMGHVLGLTHPVNGQNQIMDVTGYYGTALGSGDLMGLHILSALAGCREYPEYLLMNQEVSSAANEVTNLLNDSDSYLGTLNESGEATVKRSAVSTGLNSCGNNFPDAVQSLNLEIPQAWDMREVDGCGSGRNYSWSNPKNQSEFVVLQFRASVGWCQAVGPDDLEGIKAEFGLKVKSFEKAEIDSGRYFYVYTRSSSDNRQDVYGVIEVGNAYQWCGDGETLMEFSEAVQSNDELFSGMITSVFGSF